jgi:hypothetical protein
MQVARDPLPATVLMANAMNTSPALSDLLRQGDIPRLLNQELKERKPLKKSVERNDAPRLGSVVICPNPCTALWSNGTPTLT